MVHGNRKENSETNLQRDYRKMERCGKGESTKLQVPKKAII